MYRGNIFSNISIRWYALLWCIALLCAVKSTYAQDTSVIRSRNFGVQNEIYFNDSLWYFHAGDLTRAQQSEASTTGWDTLHYTAFGKENAPRGWRGVGWFGSWIRVDTDLVNKKLSLRINHDGASEIFLDGKPIGGYGKVGNSAREMVAMSARRELIPIWLPDTRPHLITIHYSNFFEVYANFYGFQTWIGDYNQLAPKIQTANQRFNYMLMCAAAQLILGLLHLLLFLFYPRQKLNLYYALFVLLVGINGIGIYLFYRTNTPVVQYFSQSLIDEGKVVMMWAAVMLLYILDYRKPPLWRRIALTTVCALYFIAYIYKFLNHIEYWVDYFALVFLICMMDGFWSVFHLIKKKQKGAWLISAGVVVVILLYYFTWDDVFHLWPYQLNSMRLLVMAVGELMLPLCLSLYLALNFARTNENLTAKLFEVETLSALALAQETEKRELIAGEARRLEELVRQRTAELREQADKLREMDLVKSRFFTNITHEFKTPLTLIINPAKELITETDDEHVQRYSRLILNNASRLLQLINQLLDLSRLENGSMEVNRAPLDLVALIRMHILSYESLVKQKEISLHFTSHWNKLWILGDRDKLDAIVINLISNALKFTDKGKVEIVLQQDDDLPGASFSFTIKDTGQGIPAEKLPYVFDRFYQADPSDTRSAEGTGIGLAVTKELVALMGGLIRIESEAGLFTAVLISMPYQVANAASEPILEILPAGVSPSVTVLEPITNIDGDKPLVLLIEDHQELRDFIQQSLKDNYRILTATDGKEGITFAMEHIPNLIITDLMMPHVDGYEVSSTLKKDVKTSHIPIIILTAKADTDSRIQGIETGADAYLAKPFEKRELFALMENLISVRNQLREHYSKQDLWFSNALSMPSIERDFITRVRSAVESHLNEEGYSADQLARDMGLSRTQLHRKLKDLINQSPGELIRIIRLQYAHDLLQRRVATVAEVAYMVGFSSPASFSASFSRHFGFAPKTVSAI
ncbi:response regulator [Mucilaginibacter rubeus]|uniref:histidine kinase n=1 Tax=Mucilaginibacter rubeus TaxID=2027860 RepID=A0A5C1HT04_9SPHI|nr:response regulator [Mucilaginibacter rubeus]QEM08926.1 response regulator [Mucilaginibacter rubeus]